jgi:hypothetical protein
MSEIPSSQTFANHVQRPPAALIAGMMFALLAILFGIYRVATAPALDTAVALLTGFALMLSLALGRTTALRVQDRLIRLETRLRLQQVLPADLQGQIDSLTVGQLVALRFASDAELPELTRRVLADKLTDRTAIKKQVTDWQGDTLRI